MLPLVKLTADAPFFHFLLQNITKTLAITILKNDQYLYTPSNKKLTCCNIYVKNLLASIRKFFQTDQSNSLRITYSFFNIIGRILIFFK